MLCSLFLPAQTTLRMFSSTPREVTQASAAFLATRTISEEDEVEGRSKKGPRPKASSLLVIPSFQKGPQWRPVAAASAHDSRPASQRVTSRTAGHKKGGARRSRLQARRAAERGFIGCPSPPRCKGRWRQPLGSCELPYLPEHLKRILHPPPANNIPACSGVSGAYAIVCRPRRHHDPSKGGGDELQRRRVVNPQVLHAATPTRGSLGRAQPQVGSHSLLPQVLLRKQKVLSNSSQYLAYPSQAKTP